MWQANPALIGDVTATRQILAETAAGIQAQAGCGGEANGQNNAYGFGVINAYQVYPKWWAPIVSIDDFSTLQEVKWITLGGIGELPTVAEGAAYTEMTWDDQTETASFTKKGGYLGITLEAIDKNGRVLLPDFLREEVGLGRELVLVGQGEYFEIWSPEEWAKQVAAQLDIEANNQRFKVLDLRLGSK